MVYLDNYTSETFGLYFLMVIHELDENCGWYFRYSLYFNFVMIITFLLFYKNVYINHFPYQVAAK